MFSYQKPQQGGTYQDLFYQCYVPQNTIFIFIQLYYTTKNSNTDQLCLKYLALNIILINIKIYKILSMHVYKRMEQWFYLHRYYGQR
jgi:hypothetical protein